MLNKQHTNLHREIWFNSTHLNRYKINILIFLTLFKELKRITCTHQMGQYTIRFYKRVRIRMVVNYAEFAWIVCFAYVIDFNFETVQFRCTIMHRLCTRETIVFSLVPDLFASYISYLSLCFNCTQFRIDIINRKNVDVFMRVIAVNALILFLAYLLRFVHITMRSH